ncbi:unnamed protein product [Plutella xylostella]|uniref:(diamondback moth) hypothetical protein n=1 Tax=Plutella xylostella TaxID=51655 RepID=A0A8S4FUL5_PLUXY|nr:unnamed protein product [Plutella xylostella]
MTKPASSYSLHGFCDASELGFAAVVYLRSSNQDGSVSVHLLMAKSKVAPLRTRPTIPKLELCGAVLLVKLLNHVGVDGKPRRADERDRKHPPGELTCRDVERATAARDREDAMFKGQRNSNGWLVLRDCTKYLSSQHSMRCKRYSRGSRGYQAIPMCIMAVAMSRVLHICSWRTQTTDQVLDGGDQLYQDSYLHFRPAGKLLAVEQVIVKAMERVRARAKGEGEVRARARTKPRGRVRARVRVRLRARTKTRVIARVRASASPSA